ncbi:thioredoxin fold domain-containing protein [Vibrio sp. TH_r3]|uniref:thioredoxin fold domain-containing protein n=1 Tax=Vibrio sp. TH_r3 TaxID=3082084 RepID=UPI0029558365|nr:thioredoxin fold domain-containing protein [Vibrio sp. TH_r3]MDV7105219.1 thioredoxin fold domain-containing protein [Vibrio sp. TH_r3]
MSVLRNLLILSFPFFIAACDADEVSEAEKTGSEAGTTMVTESESTPTAATFDKSVIKAQFEKMGVEVISIIPASIDGLFEVDTSGGMVFSNVQGDQFIAGTLYALDDNGEYVDVIAERKAPLNAAKIEQYVDDMIVYPAKNEKYVITVFTDTTCGYCVRLHGQMDQYNDLGITVRYLAYPRQGPNGPVAQQMAEVWCSDDPAKAMTSAKSGQTLNNHVDNLAQCSQKIVEQYSLGRELGIQGTPAVFLPNGALLAGYMPPAGMLQRIEQEMAN